MNSLKIKFLGLCSIILIVAIGLTTWYNLKTQNAMLGKLASEHGRMLAETIHRSIITDMANGKNEGVTNILAKINSEPAIKDVRIFDETGRILMTGNHQELGDLVTTSELMAYRTGNFNFTSSNSDGTDYFNSVVPIYNQPICHSCHDQNLKVLGILNLQVSLDAISDMRTSGRNATMIASGIMLVILVLTITAFLLVYVDAPIRKLVTAMDHVEQGQFDNAHAPVSSSDEMALLSSKFNFMVQRLREMMESTIRNERLMAINQEKLSHSEELHAMNQTLEDRLKEIEYLNINLEERIEAVSYTHLTLPTNRVAWRSSLCDIFSWLMASSRSFLIVDSIISRSRLTMKLNLVESRAISSELLTGAWALSNCPCSTWSMAVISLRIGASTKTRRNAVLVSTRMTSMIPDAIIVALRPLACMLEIESSETCRFKMPRTLRFWS